MVLFLYVMCFFKQKTAYEMRISDWSSDVCSSDLGWPTRPHGLALQCRERKRFLHRFPPKKQDESPVTSFASGQRHEGQIGRTSCRESVCQYVLISVVAVALKKKQTSYHHYLLSHI